MNSIHVVPLVFFVFRSLLLLHSNEHVITAKVGDDVTWFAQIRQFHFGPLRLNDCGEACDIEVCKKSIRGEATREGVLKSLLQEPLQWGVLIHENLTANYWVNSCFHCFGIELYPALNSCNFFWLTASGIAFHEFHSGVIYHKKTWNYLFFVGWCFFFRRASQNNGNYRKN